MHHFSRLWDAWFFHLNSFLSFFGIIHCYQDNRGEEEGRDSRSYERMKVCPFDEKRRLCDPGECPACLSSRWKLTWGFRLCFMSWFQTGKGVCQGCILLPCLLNLYAEHIMWNARLDKAQAGIKIAGRNTNNLIWRWHHSYGRKWRTKEPLDESERGEWKSWLKTQHSEN